MKIDIYELQELLDEDILEANADRETANKALEKIDKILKKAKFKTKGESALANLLNIIWLQAEKEFNHLL